MQDIDLSEVNLNIIKGKTVKFNLTDGYGILQYRFGKVILKIVTADGESSFKGDFKKVQKTFSELGDLKFYIEEAE